MPKRRRPVGYRDTVDWIFIDGHSYIIDTEYNHVRNQLEETAIKLLEVREHYHDIHVKAYGTEPDDIGGCHCKHCETEKN